ncbi:hypothetical protein [Streptomyces sp. NPDC031705]|uniref:hypothetical protein n=1 Tax=Streptomyces sp. NPDC031705 TaxID=3155729 RepID=UPI0033EA72B0
MSPHQVAAALGGEIPAGRTGAFPFWFWKESGQWSLHTDHFERAGVTAQYWYPEGVPELGAVTVHGRTGPQLHYEAFRWSASRLAHLPHGRKILLARRPGVKRRGRVRGVGQLADW